MGEHKPQILKHTNIHHLWHPVLEIGYLTHYLSILLPLISAPCILLHYSSKRKSRNTTNTQALTVLNTNVL